MRGVRVDPVDAARRDHLDRRPVIARVAYLDRAGVRAQQQTALDVEGCVHRPRRVILGLVERGEVVPVGLYLGTVGDVETDRAEDGLDALPGTDDGMDAARAAAAARKRHVERLLGEARVELRRLERFPARDERRLDAIP